MKTTKIMQHLIGKTYEEVSSHLNIKEDGGDCCDWSECGIDDALSFNQSRRFDTPLGILPGAQNVPKAVAYLDLGTGGYMDIGTDLTDEELDAIPKGRHMLGIVGTYGVEGYVPAQPAPIEMSITTGALSEMFLRLDGHDKAQPGYEWRKGWNDAIRQAMDYAQPAPSVPNGWKEAAIAWEVCASIHREYGKGKDPFFNTRQGDFVKHANDARAMLAAAPKQEAQPAPPKS